MPARGKPAEAPLPAEQHTPTLGRIVLYRLSEADAEAINRRRDAWRDSPSARWGYVAHVGARVKAGQQFPAVVVNVLGSQAVALKVLLDGSDDLWAASATEGDHDAGWTWPPRA